MKHINVHFIARMDSELEANQHKGDWSAWHPDRFQATSELHHHTRKLIAAIYCEADYNVQECAADLANIAMKCYETFQPVAVVERTDL
jgi:hypothetical protein